FARPRLPPSYTLFPYTTLFRSPRKQALQSARQALQRLAEAFNLYLPGVRAELQSNRQDELKILVQQGHIQVKIEVSSVLRGTLQDRKSTRLNSSHVSTSYAVFC